ncbi:MAG: PIN domain-containing protein [Burkholderiaceae bacterium]
MSAEIFVDTNLLFYANTASADLRHEQARSLIETLRDKPGSAATSVQVLQELHVNLVKKARLSFSDSAQRVRDYLAWKVIDNDRSLLSAAFDVQSRWQLGFWDSMIIAAAQRSGAPILWSEDLANGQQYDGVRVVNPLSTD